MNYNDWFIKGLINLKFRNRTPSCTIEENLFPFLERQA